ncbi:DUF7711 family protein [Phytoactinopolyspora limicola]|uniref:DUF7711 family protein n=1 Tax=Phytoactinopolyspora limicola TaxID=2715536 RepID=UPI00140A8D0A|nr:hypothetical protein [Phytoactinopolyspora limicola]
MRRATAIRRLYTLAEGCEQVRRFPVEKPVLIAAYATGDVLEAVPEIEFVHVVFVLDVPASELVWGTYPPEHTSWLEYQLRLDRTPVSYRLRPSAWPVWNQHIRRPLKFWSLDGTETEALVALSAGDAESYRLPAPSPEEEAAQLALELDASRVYLRHVRDEYWKRGWRSQHKGYGIYPENHLWNAVDGYFDLLDAVGQRDGS